MKCEYCGGAIIYRPGNSVEPARTVCMACGREPKEKEEKMDEKTKKCTKCKKDLPLTPEFFPKNSLRSDGFEAKCKDCKNKYQRDLRERTGGGNKRKGEPKRKRRTAPDPAPQAVAEGILLDQQLIKAIKRSVAKEIVGIIEERFI